MQRRSSSPRPPRQRAAGSVAAAGEHLAEPSGERGIAPFAHKHAGECRMLALQRRRGGGRRLEVAFELVAEILDQRRGTRDLVVRRDFARYRHGGRRRHCSLPCLERKIGLDGLEHAVRGAAQCDQVVVGVEREAPARPAAIVVEQPIEQPPALVSAPGGGDRLDEPRIGFEARLAAVGGIAFPVRRADVEAPVEFERQLAELLLASVGAAQVEQHHPDRGHRALLAVDMSTQHVDREVHVMQGEERVRLASPLDRCSRATVADGVRSGATAEVAAAVADRDAWAACCAGAPGTSAASARAPGCASPIPDRSRARERRGRWRERARRSWCRASSRSRRGRAVSGRFGRPIVNAPAATASRPSVTTSPQPMGPKGAEASGSGDRRSPAATGVAIGSNASAAIGIARRTTREARRQMEAVWFTVRWMRESACARGEVGRRRVGNGGARSVPLR